MKYLSKTLFAFLVLLTVGIAGVAAMSDLFVYGTWRYRITVEIETPEGIKSGSAVRQVSNSSSSVRLDLPEAGNPAEVIGEAVVVDLGERGVVFSLMSNDLYRAFPNPKGPSTLEGIKYYNDTLKPGKKAELKTNHPKIVTFTDMDDPKSVKLVKGGRFNKKTQKHDPVDDFEAIFGSGVLFKAITIEITDDSVTWGLVDKYLPSKLQELKNNWRKLPYSEKQRINKLITFKQGEKK